MVPSAEERVGYLKGLRARTAYPTVRGLARAISVLLYVLAALSVVLAIVIIGIAVADSEGPRSRASTSGYGTAGFVLLMLLQAVWFVVLGRVVVEVTAMFTDAADCLVDSNLRAMAVRGASVPEAAQGMPEHAITDGIAGMSSTSPESEQLAGRLFDRAAQAARSGDKSEAMRLLRSVLELYPGTEAARKAERSLNRR